MKGKALSIKDQWPFGIEKCFCFPPKFIHMDICYSHSIDRSVTTVLPDVQLETLLQSGDECDFIYLFKGTGCKLTTEEGTSLNCLLKMNLVLLF